MKKEEDNMAQANAHAQEMRGKLKHTDVPKLTSGDLHAPITVHLHAELVYIISIQTYVPLS